jgi:hypothetical protein
MLRCPASDFTGPETYSHVPPSYPGTGDQDRGEITRAGNAHIRGQLCEAAWTYQYCPAIGRTIKARQAGVSPATVARAWSAQVRLSARFRALAARKNVKSVVAAAVARELAGFCWAEMTATG